MAESFEQLLIRMGFDATAVEQGTLAMVARQESAAAKTKAIWAEADREREMSYKASIEAMIVADEQKAAQQGMIEQAALDASFARYQKNMAAKAAADKAWMEERAAMAAIGSGSGGYGSGFVTAEQKAAAGAEREGLKELEAGAIGAAGAAAVGRAGKAGIIRESMVLIREGVRGAWTKVAGSLSLLAQYAGVSAMTMVTSIPVIGTGAAAIWGNLKMKRELQDMAGGYGMIESSRQSEEIIRKRLNKQIDNLVLAGMISPQRAELLKSANIASAQRDLRPLLPNGFEKFETTDEKIKKTDELAAREKKELDDMLSKKRDEKTLEQDITDKQEAIAFIKKNIAALDDKSLESHEAKEQLIRAELDLQKDLTQQAEQQKKHEEEIAKWKEWSAKAALDYMRNQISSAMDEAAYPTIENLAGRSWVARLNRGYGKGGRFDLGAGNGPYSGLARDYLLAQKQQEWDRTYGNMGIAEMDRQRMIYDRNQLVSAGVASPEMLLSKIESNTDKMHALWNSLVRNGVIQTGINDPNGENQ